MRYKIAVITSNFGDIDHEKGLIPQVIDHDYQFFCFSEKSKLHYPREEFSSRLKARFFKTQHHDISELKKFDIFVWIDSSFHITSSGWLKDIIKRLEESKLDIAIMPHPSRNCIYEEVQFTMKTDSDYLRERYAKEKCTYQVAEYSKEGIASNSGLYAGGMFARYNNDRTNYLFDKWWNEITKWSTHDQVSLSYLIIKLNLEVCKLPYNIFTNEFFNLMPHKGVK